MAQVTIRIGSFLERQEQEAESFISALKLTAFLHFQFSEAWNF